MHTKYFLVSKCIFLFHKYVFLLRCTCKRVFKKLKNGLAKWKLHVPNPWDILLLTDIEGSSSYFISYFPNVLFSNTCHCIVYCL